MDVVALDSGSRPVGRVVLETGNKIVVVAAAGNGSERYEILKSEVQSVRDGKVTIGLPFYELVRRYRRDRQEPASKRKGTRAHWVNAGYTDYATFSKSSSGSLYGRQVMTLDEECIGYIAREEGKTIVAVGHYDFCFEIPKSMILAVTGSSVMLYADYGSAFKYRVETGRNAAPGAPSTAKEDR
jgi:hypothetical protein